MKVVSIIGARPQFVKAAVLSRVLRKNHQEYLIHTGQHYDENMSQIFFDDLEIPQPNINLEVGSESHAVQTAEMMIGIEKVILSEKPDLLVVYGDTNSTIAGALAAIKVHIPVAHVEAGLRSFNWDMPEEINRVLTDRISQFLFCPSETSMNNLKSEGLAEKSYLVGDVMVDSLDHFSKIAEKKVNPLKRFNLNSTSYSLVTIHRPVNTDNPDNLRNILSALKDCEETIIFPLHPRTKSFLEQKNWMENLQKSNIIFTEPLSYLENLLMEKSAKRIITDSGGMQKEAYIWGVPCVTLREETEWIETIEEEWNILVGADYNKILLAIDTFKPTKHRAYSYGDGNACEKIVNILEDNFK